MLVSIIKLIIIKLIFIDHIKLIINLISWYYYSCSS